MSIADIRTLYEYNAWAAQKILDQTSLVSPEQYAAPAPVPFGSLRGTLVHMMSAQHVWRMRCQEGISPKAMLAEADYPTIDALLALWTAERAALSTYLQTLTDTDLLQNIRYNNTKGIPFEVRLSHILTHVVNHSTQHRSEAAMLLTQYGRSPGDIDYIVYVIEKHPSA